MFWIDTAVATLSGSSAADVDWSTLDWAAIRIELDRWIDTLNPDTLDMQSAGAQFHVGVPSRDDVMLVFRARPRTEQARGHQREPSLVIGERPPLPLLHFDDGSSGYLNNLSIEMVKGLAEGRRKLAISLPSNQDAWEMLLEEMQHFGHDNTSEMEPLLLEPTAAALGLTVQPAGLIDFDEGWRVVNRVDMPITDDPRDT